MTAHDTLNHVTDPDDHEFPAGFGVNVIGFVTNRIGIGVAARITIAALLEAGVPVAVAEAPLRHRGSGSDLTYSALQIRNKRRLPYPVTLVHMNPVEAGWVRRIRPHWFRQECTFSVPFWELSELQKRWIPRLSRYDAVLAPTEYIASAIRRDVSVPVHRFPIAANAPTVAPIHRSEFGIPDDRFAFVSGWDASSGRERKGGLLVLRAFEMLLSRGVDATMVIKLNGSRHPQELDATLSRLPRERVVVISEHLPYERVLGLYAACDAYVSLHRAEGLGLGLQEAMLLGIPVIATGWSGNMDFMDKSSAALVGYTMTPVVDDQREYAPRLFARPQFWAEPDLTDAADQMERLAANPELRAALGAAGREHVMRYRETWTQTAPRLLAGLYREHLAR
jgi:glycosyltransferase involved in cell wall biosynthesis